MQHAIDDSKPSHPMTARRGSTRRMGQLAAICLTLAVPAVGQQVDKPAAPTAQEAARLREEMHRMIVHARDKVFPALVNIHVVTVNYWNGKEQKGRAVGSGTIISPEGYVVTNQHVTDNGKKFKCTLADKTEISAEMVGEDPLTDLAVLKLNLSERPDPDKPLPVATFGNSDQIDVGDHVMAMGSPLALSRSVTLGIVSNTERVFTSGLGGDDEDEMELGSGQRTGLFTRWIQHDAMIHPGNSGGPLVNLKGEIIGVNELGGTGMGFAIPSNLARAVTESLIAHGEVIRSYFGVSLRSIEKTGLSHGVLVNSVAQDGPAFKAGIQAGDVILKINGEPVTIRFPEEIPPLMKRLADLPVGDKVRISYERGGQVGEAEIATEKLKKDKGDEAAFRAWGVTAAEITERMARERRLKSTEGVMISSIRSGGPAALAEPSLSWGDIIHVVEGRPIGDLNEFIRCYREIMETEPLPEYLLIEFERSGRSHITLLKPKPDKEEDPPREVPKAWIGIDTQPVLTKLASKLGHPDDRGFRVTRVFPRTRAAETDLKVGDIILSLDGEKLSPRGMQDAGLFSRRVRKLDIDGKATLTVLRGNEKIDVEVPLERTRLTPSEAKRERDRDFEMVVREITFFDRDENHWDDDVTGVIVDQVESAGWAGLGGISGGDLLQRIDDKVITDLKSFRRAMDEIVKKQPERVVMVVLRGIRTNFQYLEPDWKPHEEGEENGAAGKAASQPDGKKDSAKPQQ